MEPLLSNKCQFLDDRSERESGAAVKPEFAREGLSSVDGASRMTDSCSLLLGRWPMMLGTNPVSYISLFTRWFLVM